VAKKTHGRKKITDLCTMNFLAHFYLAFDNEQRLVGQFIADAVKGRTFDQYDIAVQQGIRQHRLVDHLTEISEGPRALRALLRPHCGLLSPVAVDMLLDHILAKQWSLHHHQSLPHFAQVTYQTLEKNHSSIPPRMLEALHYMKMYDWLNAYATKEGILKSINGLSKRVQGGQLLLNIAPVFEDIVNQAETAFDNYFPELREAIQKEIFSS
jgi:acyl carrier protein phosphodiesterase